MMHHPKGAKDDTKRLVLILAGLTAGGQHAHSLISTENAFCFQGFCAMPGRFEMVPWDA